MQSDNEVPGGDTLDPERYEGWRNIKVNLFFRATLSPSMKDNAFVFLFQMVASILNLIDY